MKLKPNQKLYGINESNQNDQLHSRTFCPNSFFINTETSNIFALFSFYSPWNHFQKLRIKKNDIKQKKKNRDWNGRGENAKENGGNAIPDSYIWWNRLTKKTYPKIFVFDQIKSFQWVWFFLFASMTNQTETESIWIHHRRLCRRVDGTNIDINLTLFNFVWWFWNVWWNRRNNYPIVSTSNRIDQRDAERERVNNDGC